MPTSDQRVNPFGGNNSSVQLSDTDQSNPVGDFIIRTMQDDLLSNSAPAYKKIPTPEIKIIPQPVPRPILPKEAQAQTKNQVAAHNDSLFKRLFSSDKKDKQKLPQQKINADIPVPTPPAPPQHTPSAAIPETIPFEKTLPAKIVPATATPPQPIPAKERLSFLGETSYNEAQPIQAQEKNYNSQARPNPSTINMNSKVPSTQKNNAPAYEASPFITKENHEDQRPGAPVTPPKQKTSNKSLSFAISAVVLLVVLVVGIGIYYFMATRTSQEKVQITQNTPENTPVAEVPVTINPPSDKYSSTSANYLPINIAGASSSDILKTLSSVTADLGSSSSSTPTEFTIVDTNNNPIVFHAFAAAIGLKLSNGVLSALGDNFSVYYFQDAAATRLGLAVETKDLATLKTALLKEEPALPAELSPLFLTAPMEIKTGLFKDSSYQNDAIRYLNLSSQSSLSTDYTVTDKQLLIGTSKGTLRSIIDKRNIPAAASSVINNDSGIPTSPPVVSIPDNNQ